MLMYFIELLFLSCFRQSGRTFVEGFGSVYDGIGNAGLFSEVSTQANLDFFKNACEQNVEGVDQVEISVQDIDQYHIPVQEINCFPGEIMFLRNKYFLYTVKM